jgi:hypothetical protein
VSFGRNNQERRDRVTRRADGLDNCNLFPITRLGLLCLSPAVRACHDYSCRDLAYYKPGLVEVIDIRVNNRVFGNCIPYKLKPAPNNL